MLKHAFIQVRVAALTDACCNCCCTWSMATQMSCNWQHHKHTSPTLVYGAGSSSCLSLCLPYPLSWGLLLSYCGPLNTASHGLGGPRAHANLDALCCLLKSILLVVSGAPAWQSWLKQMGIFLKQKAPHQLVMAGLDGFFGQSSPHHLQHNPFAQVRMAATSGDGCSAVLCNGAVRLWAMLSKRCVPLVSNSNE